MHQISQLALNCPLCASLQIRIIKAQNVPLCAVKLGIAGRFFAICFGYESKGEWGWDAWAGPGGDAFDAGW